MSAFVLWFAKAMKVKKRLLLTNNTILELLNMNVEELLKPSENFGGKFRCAVGATKELESFAQNTQRAWV